MSDYGNSQEKLRKTSKQKRQGGKPDQVFKSRKIDQIEVMMGRNVKPLQNQQTSLLAFRHCLIGILAH